MSPDRQQKFFMLYQGIITLCNEMACTSSPDEFSKSIELIRSEAHELLHEKMAAARLCNDIKVAARAARELNIRNDWATLISGMFALSKEVMSSELFRDRPAVDSFRDYDIFARSEER